MLFLCEMEVRLPPDMPAAQARRAQGARARVLAGGPARRALAAPVAGRRALRERQRARRRLGRRAARAAVRPSAVPVPGHSRHAAGAPPERHRPRREPMTDRANQLIADILRRDPRGDRRARHQLRGVPGRQAVVHRRRRGGRVAAVRRRVHRARGRGAGVRQPQGLPGHDPRPVPRAGLAAARRAVRAAAPSRRARRPHAHHRPRDRRRRPAAGEREPRHLAGRFRGSLLGLHARPARRATSAGRCAPTPTGATSTSP